MSRLEGKVAIVTAPSKGIGASIAEHQAGCDGDLHSCTFVGRVVYTENLSTGC
jgi:NAD(P)-dependent dehydrogenase (short-subunit alcohol dehydrogenase family)